MEQGVRIYFYTVFFNLKMQAINIRKTKSELTHSSIS